MKKKTLNNLLFAEIMRQHGLPVVQDLAETHRDNRDRDAGGFQYGLVIGWGWPKNP